MLIEVLVELSVHAHDEDAFGTVTRDFHIILDCLMEILNALESYSMQVTTLKAADFPKGSELCQAVKGVHDFCNELTRKLGTLREDSVLSSSYSQRYSSPEQ